MQKWVDRKMRCRGTLIFIRLLFFLYFKNKNCLQYNRIKVNLLIMYEDDGVGSMSVKHCLIVSNLWWTWQPFALFTTLYTLMDQELSGPRIWCYELNISIGVTLFNLFSPGVLCSCFRITMTTCTNQYKSEHSSCACAPQASCGTQMTHGQNLPILIDRKRPQVDGVKMKAWTREWWKVGSLWHHLPTGEKRQQGSGSEPYF